MDNADFICIIVNSISTAGVLHQNTGFLKSTLGWSCSERKWRVLLFIRGKNKIVGEESPRTHISD